MGRSGWMPSAPQTALCPPQSPRAPPASKFLSDPSSVALTTMCLSPPAGACPQLLSAPAPTRGGAHPAEHTTLSWHSGTRRQQCPGTSVSTSVGPSPLWSGEAGPTDMQVRQTQASSTLPLTVGPARSWMEGPWEAPSPFTSRIHRQAQVTGDTCSPWPVAPAEGTLALVLV